MADSQKVKELPLKLMDLMPLAKLHLCTYKKKRKKSEGGVDVEGGLVDLVNHCYIRATPQASGPLPLPPPLC